MCVNVVCISVSGPGFSVNNIGYIYCQEATKPSSAVSHHLARDLYYRLVLEKGRYVPFTPLHF